MLPRLALRISIHVPREGDDVVTEKYAEYRNISIHVPREGDDTLAKKYGDYDDLFLSTSPARGTTPGTRFSAAAAANFYPRPPRGGRLSRRYNRRAANAFLSTSPARGTTDSKALRALGKQFLSTSPARGTTVGFRCDTTVFNISIHVPREGDDILKQFAGVGKMEFLSTSPARGTTCRACTPGILRRYFYPRPPRGGRRSLDTSPYFAQLISIHVPREGDDCGTEVPPDPPDNFYPRPPRGGRPPPSRSPKPRMAFLSTSPARGTTRQGVGAGTRRGISIHVPREGDDQHAIGWVVHVRISIHVPREGDDDPGLDHQPRDRHFYPRPPRGGRPGNWAHAEVSGKISIHVPREGDDAHCASKHVPRFLFLSTSPARGTTWGAKTSRRDPTNFYPRPPRGGRHCRR